MSPARLSSEDMSQAELSFEGMGSPQPNKKQKMQPENENRDMFDDIETLWETRWKSAVSGTSIPLSQGVGPEGGGSGRIHIHPQPTYPPPPPRRRACILTNSSSQCKCRQAPFQDASYLDFAPLFASLIQRGITTARSPLYTHALLTAATAIADTIATAQAADPALATASRLLNACALLRVARLPAAATAAEPCPLKQRAHALQRDLHARAAQLRNGTADSPVHEVLIPHVHEREHQHAGAAAASQPARRGRSQIPAVVRVPLATLQTGRACPAAVVVASSDRLGCTAVCERVLARGWAAVVVDGPGCGECPVAAGDGDGEARLWRSVLDWMGAMGFYDMDRVVVMSEGEAALRVAGTAGDRLRGVVAYVNGDEGEGKDEGEGQAMLETQPLCPSLVVRERRGWTTSNGVWTPVKEEEEEEGEEEAPNRGGGYKDLYSFGTQDTACIGRLQTTTGWAQVFAWVEDLLVGRAGGHFWTVIPAPDKVAGAMPGRFERELTPPSPEGLDVTIPVAVLL